MLIISKIGIPIILRKNIIFYLFLVKLPKGHHNLIIQHSEK